MTKYLQAYGANSMYLGSILALDRDSNGKLNLDLTSSTIGTRDILLMDPKKLTDTYGANWWNLFQAGDVKVVTEVKNQMQKAVTALARFGIKPTVTDYAFTNADEATINKAFISNSITQSEELGLLFPEIIDQFIWLSIHTTVFANHMETVNYLAASLTTYLAGSRTKTKDTPGGLLSTELNSIIYPATIEKFFSTDQDVSEYTKAQAKALRTFAEALYQADSDLVDLDPFIEYDQYINADKNATLTFDTKKKIEKHKQQFDKLSAQLEVWFVVASRLSSSFQPFHLPLLDQNTLLESARAANIVRDMLMCAYRVYFIKTSKGGEEFPD